MPDRPEVHLASPRGTFPGVSVAAPVPRRTRVSRLAGCVVALVGLAACATPEPGTPAVLSPSQLPSGVSPLLVASDTAALVDPTLNAAASPQLSPTAGETADTPSPDAWQSLPIVPAISDTAQEIYRRGLEMGNDPNAFSKVGDCQNVPSLFLSAFDYPGQYGLGEYAILQETIDHFAGSWSRVSQAVRRGFNAASILSPFWANHEFCESGESPLECEFRLHHPSIAIISLETWWEGAPENYERYLREIVEYTIARGVVPILATKADNMEGEWRINVAIARLAQEYDIPLWNFWAAAQPLPNHGLLEDGFHLTLAGNYFDDPVRMRAAWPWRNLTALQAIDAVWHGVASAAPADRLPGEVP